MAVPSWLVPPWIFGRSGTGPPTGSGAYPPRVGGLFGRGSIAQKGAQSISKFLPNLPGQQGPMTNKQMIGYAGIKGVGAYGAAKRSKLAQKALGRRRAIWSSAKSRVLPRDITKSREQAAGRGMLSTTLQKRREAEIREPWITSEQQLLAQRKAIKDARKWSWMFS